MLILKRNEAGWPNSLILNLKLNGAGRLARLAYPQAIWGARYLSST